MAEIDARSTQPGLFEETDLAEVQRLQDDRAGLLERWEAVDVELAE